MPEHLNCELLFHRLLPSSLPLCIFSNLSAARMKNKASTFLKQVISVIVAMVKAKSLAVKRKTSAMKTQLLIFGVLRHKKLLMSAINHKIHALLAQEKGGESLSSPEDHSKAIVIYNAEKNEARPSSSTRTESVDCEDDDDDDYPDLTHSLFEDEDEDDDDGLGDTTGSVIDLVRNSKEDGKEFSLEDEIDLVADVFIKRFHRQMRMQKLESFKRYQEMLERSV